MLVTYLKRTLRRTFPGLLSQYHSYNLTRMMKNTGLKTTPFGFNLIGHEGMQSGIFEPEETRFLSEFLDDDSVFVDVGANIGYYLCLARQRGAHVIGVEPSRQNLDFLYLNLDANAFTDIEIFPVGLSENPGLATLYGGSTSASMVKGWAGMSDVWRNTIPLSTLDIILNGRFLDRRMLIMIDVEGNELNVLKGASRTLAREKAPAWMVEISLTRNCPGGINHDFLETFEMFWGNGYAARSAESKEVVTREMVLEWIEKRGEGVSDINFLFEKPEC